MYKSDQFAIQDHAWGKGPAYIRQVMALAILSIRQPFYKMDEQIIDKDKYMFGHKKYAWAEIQEMSGPILMFHLNAKCTVKSMEWLTQVHGIGMVKAGFILQMLGHEVGCLDSHNIAMYGLDAKFLRRKPTEENIELYLELCRKLGGAEHLWDRWCERLAIQQPTRWRDADHVSMFHRDTIAKGYRHEHNLSDD